LKSLEKEILDFYQREELDIILEELDPSPKMFKLNLPILLLLQVLKLE